MKIFISYRRRDTAGFSGRLSDRLAAHWGADAVLRDIDSIPLGADFQTVIAQEIAQCDVVLTVIGLQWLEGLSDVMDFVRLEIESAFSRGIPVVPVLMEDAFLPTKSELPPSLSALVDRQAVRVGYGAEFHRDADVLIRAIEGLFGRRHSPLDAQNVDPQDLRANHVFVCHATEDRRWVEREVVSTLHEARIVPWYAKTAIKTAAQWEREILRGLEKSDWFLIVISPRAAKSEWVKDELFWAMQYRLTRIVPVVMERCDLYQFHIRLARIQNIDFTEDLSDAKGKLLEAVAQ